jgi:uncharacterized protein
MPCPMRTSNLFISNALAALLTLIAGLTLTNATPSAKAPPEAPRCGGINLVDKIATEHPELYRELVEEALRIPNAEALLWKVEKSGTAPSYLFGTMHVSDPRITNLSANVNAALAAANAIALEIADISAGAMIKEMGARADLMVYTDGSRLDHKLTPEEFAVAKDALAEAGVPEQVAPMIRPWFVYLMMAVPPCEIARTKNGKPVLDAKLAKLGIDRNTSVVSLETIPQQISVMADLPEEDQIGLLKFSLAFADKREDMLETLIQLYQRRQIAQMVPLSNALAKLRGIKLAGMDAFMKSAVVERNYGMRDKAMPLLEKGAAFIAVGTLHLVGDKGLVALFREKGYSVTAIE